MTFFFYFQTFEQLQTPLYTYNLHSEPNATFIRYAIKKKSIARYPSKQIQGAHAVHDVKRTQQQLYPMVRLKVYVYRNLHSRK